MVNTQQPRQCYYIDPTQDPEAHDGYVPSLVTENVAGHQPLMGQGECSTPWVWGKTLDEADEVCRQQNEKHGIDPKTADKIVTSSIRISLQGGD